MNIIVQAAHSVYDHWLLFGGNWRILAAIVGHAALMSLIIMPRRIF